ncbi:MAG: uridine diphosphate-N-acetylglucosamine-binding protein YvcK [Acidobacteria bacterium]|nr:MAG: uridine diphosphate-N-acetylglucosamine-binding protein YvcK [Acidobacteriota bacterium]REJ98904.1 MAG: uridine diphosphate-N-acetylglucosamine-binding protein YvcK [Acidobacteriota bacterium]REK16376.1 MAG: uridine diphosphate-N-acetylglucosamine-binding protein YvcK [Acidobacteriota bacterium]REK44057.1 MAG: uridine diphosphate-N-acetylglucosamine-binding protein YvcK [Acidobacteriota bacterium]
MRNHVFSSPRGGLRTVSIGGGNGLATLLSGLKSFVGEKNADPVWIKDLAAVVAVSDDGGSSGRIREELQILAPGDIRNCMVALSEDSHLLARLFRYRFTGEGELAGHSFGNLFLAALSEVTGDFAEAVKLSSEILVSKGHIYPATVEDVRLVAELEGGEEVYGETNVGMSGNSIKRLRLEPESCEPLPETLEAIREADLITVGPGSLFTSLLPPLLVEGVAPAIAESSAVKIFVSNLMTQPGETDGFTALRHLEVIAAHAPGISFDYLIINNEPIKSDQAEKYGGKGARQVGLGNSISQGSFEGVKIIYDNLLDTGEKVRHHPEMLARNILECAASLPSEDRSSGKDRRITAD